MTSNTKKSMKSVDENRWIIEEPKEEERISKNATTIPDPLLDPSNSQKYNNVTYKINGAIDTNDPVNHPSHYTQGNIECIDAMQNIMTKESFAGYLRGNAFKYIWRCEDKNNPVEDIDKAIWYLTKLRSVYENQ